MGKYSHIINSPWIDMTLYPESIPHLLHHDLAYLWVLEKESHLRPKFWAERLEAWRCLIELFFIGELEVKEDPIREPLIRYTRPHGITKVSWVVLRNSDEVVGVLSPVVLMRPLPDFTSHDLIKWTHRLAERRRPNEFPFYLQLAISVLNAGRQHGPFRSRLAAILENEFTPGQMNNPPANANGAHISLPILRKFIWTQRLEESPVMDQVDVMIRAAGENGGDPVYVPRCRTCSYILTKARTSQPISVEGDTFSVPCENPAGAHANQLNLADFLIWARTDNKVVVWGQEGAPSIPERGFPPKSYVRGIQVEFEWNAAQLLGETEKRFLVLQFRDKELIIRRLRDIFFEKLLVPGRFENFKGLPVRPEWIDALENPHGVAVVADGADARVIYREMRIKGWPMPLRWTYAGNLGVVKSPDLGVGIYPDPAVVPERWRWYRCFLQGPSRSDYRIKSDSSKTILPWLVEEEKGKPKGLSVTNQSGDTGVTYFGEEVVTRYSEAARPDVFLGIDFGTTNTMIYFLPLGGDANNLQPERHGLKPSHLSTNVKWLAESDAAVETVGDFLPGPKYRERFSDPYIIPSALWNRQDQFLVRWGAEDPIQGVQPLGGFKWDVKGKDHYTYRKAYLRELLLVSLPLVISKIGLNTSKAKFNLGYAFPLAFDHKARQDMQQLLDEIDLILHEATGFDFESYSINESTACVRAFGMFEPGDTFLVADMGGGTMDLSFFTFANAGANDIHQIGSVEFAGETFVRALTRKKQPDVQKQEATYWKLKDSINSEKSKDEYGGDDAAQIIVHRLGGLAFEFLRTLVAAYRQVEPERSIKLVLVGNGWHLAEAFSAETQKRGAKRLFKEHYEHLLRQLDEYNLSLYFGAPLPSLPSSKHLTVIGALRNVSGPQKKKELNDDLNLSKLPAGRDFGFNTTLGQLKRIEWHELVGEALALDGYTKQQLTGGGSYYELKKIPDLVEPWRSYLLNLFGVHDEADIPYPDDSNLREKIYASIDGHPAKIFKGPLQIILEQRWTDWLTED